MENTQKQYEAIDAILTEILVTEETDATPEEILALVKAKQELYWLLEDMTGGCGCGV